MEPSSNRFEQDLTRIETRYGSFEVPAEHDLISNSLRSYGEWAEIEISVLRGLLQTGDVALDIGACFGTHTRAFSQAVGSAGRVISFEPGPESFAILARNAALATEANIEVRKRAVGVRSGALLAQVAADGNMGGSSLVTPTEGFAGATVETIAIDDLALDQVNFMKIDVEGMEPAVIAGAAQTIRRHRPIVFCEVNSVSAGVDLLRAWNFDRYKVIGLRTAAFNPASLRAGQANMFGAASECGLLFLPLEFNRPLPEDQFGVAFMPISGIEDIVTLMLGQLQYLHMHISRGDRDHALVQLWQRGERDPQGRIADLEQVLTKILERPWRPFEEIVKRYLALALSAIVSPFSKRAAETFRASALRRNPRRFVSDRTDQD